MLRFVPSLRVVPPYYDHPAYVEALAESVREAMTSRPRPPEKVIISFHGIPQAFVDSGDPYASHCEATARSLAARAGWKEGSYVMAYQSRAGREPWLLPNTDDTFVELARTGLRHIMVICPGFVTDCLETIDEIGYVGLQQFQAAGGETLQLVACLNDRPQWIAAMTRIVLEQLQGWRVRSMAELSSALRLPCSARPLALLAPLGPASPACLRALLEAPHLHGQTKQVDEPARGGDVVAAHREAGQLRVVERERRGGADGGGAALLTTSRGHAR